ncbi:Ldh family oxidoreductase (plasmid) [Leisingera caerulea]|nr:Ldh family oxidoreductase [Leisingera caerulea]
MVSPDGIGDDLAGKTKALQASNCRHGFHDDRLSRRNPVINLAMPFEGVCLPFGGVKGSVLGTMMDLMSGALTGANFGGEVKSLYFDHSEPQNVGHLFFAIRPDLFMAMTDFEARMEEFNRRIKALPRAAGCDEILMPGEPEARTEAKRRANGIPVTDNVVADLAKIAEKRGLPPLAEHLE